MEPSNKKKVPISDLKLGSLGSENHPQIGVSVARFQKRKFELKSTRSGFQSCKATLYNSIHKEAEIKYLL